MPTSSSFIIVLQKQQIKCCLNKYDEKTLKSDDVACVTTFANY